jgi:hypothetical protein
MADFSRNIRLRLVFFFYIWMRHNGKSLINYAARWVQNSHEQESNTIR